WHNNRRWQRNRCRQRGRSAQAGLPLVETFGLAGLKGGQLLLQRGGARIKGVNTLIQGGLQRGVQRGRGGLGGGSGFAAGLRERLIGGGEAGLQAGGGV